MVAINKPHGLLVHRTKIAADAKVFALQLLRQQLGRYVYPVHRLDRKTAGVLLFAFDKATTKALQATLQDKQTQKKYLAIVRGYFPEKIRVDYPLTNDRGKTQQAVTTFEKIRQVELPIAFGRYATARYSLIAAMPQTGRMHQIRKHLNHLRHPIIGDRPHGCNKQNKLFKNKWAMTTMLLHAWQLRFIHPIHQQSLTIEAPLFSEFERMLPLLQLGLGEVSKGICTSDGN